MSAQRKERPKIDHPYVFSVSQVQNFRRCPRKWAYEKIDGLKDPGSDSTELGGLVHDQLEKYLEEGRPIAATTKEGKIAMSALPHLPPPRFPGMQIEQWFTVYIPEVVGKHGEGAYFQGLKDLEILEGWRTERPFVSDHKTTKNFMWAKTEKELTEDVQSGLYSHDTMVKTGATEVDLQWTYMRTVGPSASQPTYAVITQEQVARIMWELTITTQEMIDTKDNNPTALTVVQDPSGCDAFGGCCFKEKCNLSPREKLKAIMTQVKKESSVLQRLKDRKNAKSGGSTEKASEAAEPAAAASEKPAKAALHVVQEEAAEEVINPPEGENAVEPTLEEAKAAASKGKKGASKTTAKAAKAATSPELESSQGVLGRAVDAFWGVLVDDLASRIAEKLNK